ncbi:hypothetical protein N9R43_01510 [bacterium]|nr:hypothetical protein [bacterium]
MNFSEYTLVSFGDSFTFGQGVVPHYNDADYDREYWKEHCHANSYTKFVADKLNFKDVINLGIPGNSNTNIVFQIENYLRNNDKVFVLYNLTQQARTSVHLYDPEYKRFALENISINNFDKRQNQLDFKWFSKYFDVYRNGAQLIHEYVDLLHRLDTIFARYDTRNLGVDILGDIPSIILGNNLKVKDVYLPDDFQYQSYEPYQSFFDSVYNGTRYIKDLSIPQDFGDPTHNFKRVYKLFESISPSVISDDKHFTVKGNELFANECVKLIKQGEYND